MTSFFRYPGGKSKLRKEIIAKLHFVSQGLNLEYREPFFGGGSIGLEYIQQTPLLQKIWINDFDLGVSSLWSSLLNQPEELKQKVKTFVPSVEAFDQFKEELVNPVKATTCLDWGFKKLAIHQISYSGLGVKSGGPLGGREQKSNYKIDCRWSPQYICKKIDLLHKKFSKFQVRENQCTALDFSKVVEDRKHPALIYLDPPYFIKGNELYQFGFTLEDHQRLARCLKDTSHKWVLSYDDCPEIRELYKWAEMEIINVNYSITALKDKSTGDRTSRQKPELLIYKA
jgi:DNA adenine methylase